MDSRKILYFFNHLVKPVAELIAAREAPSDRLYGMVELKKKGWVVDACDERLTPLEQFFRTYTFSFVGWSALKKCLNSDILVVKDNFSLMLSLLALVFRKKIIYLDSLFYIPSNKIRRFLLRLNLWVAPVVVSYSRFQAELWAREFGVAKTKFVILPYTIDTDFYRAGFAQVKDVAEDCEKFILSVGRDMGRDYGTLIRAAQNAGIKVKVVTLPYLVPQEARDNPNVEILQNLSYPQLFSLYRRATLVAVPLIKGVEYPSGIRAALESMLLGKATICTTTPILEEYVAKDSGATLYVRPEDEAELTAAILRVLGNADYKRELESAGSALVSEAFGMQAFVESLDELLKTQLKD